MRRMASGDHPPHPDAAREDPPRFRTGDWAWDPKEDPYWDDPSTPRLVLRPGEYGLVADALVRRQPLTIDGHEVVIVDKSGDAEVRFCELDLRWLYEEIIAHPDARLARATEPDRDGFIRPAGVFDQGGNKVDEAPTRLALHGCVVTEANFSSTVIACTLNCTGRFATDAWFRAARLCGYAGFESARFAGHAWFSDTCFARVADFDDACFRGEASFTDNRFGGTARFRGSRFEEIARFDDARFAWDASFGFTRFAERASFWSARFARVANFGYARFAGAADFGSARFAGAALFWEARFAKGGDFGSTRFAGNTGFWDARFAGTAEFGSARFAGTAEFWRSRFAGDARFEFATIGLRSRLRFNDAHFTGTLDLSHSTIRGKVFLTRASLDERVLWDGARLGPKARLGFNRCLARGGGTIELRREQLRPTIADRSAVARRRVGLGGRPKPTLRRIVANASRPLRPVGEWLGLVRPLAVLEGDDSHDPEAMERAAHDYELLAANYRNQPATDWEEDWCRWRAHELNRRAARARADRRLCTPPPHARPNVVRACGEWLSLLVRWPAFWLYHDVWGWFVKRTLVGYLLQPHRIFVAGAVVMLAFTALYAVAIGRDDIGHGSFPPTEVAADVWDYGDAYRYWEKDLFNPFYLSVTTFVTLGYGDFSPAAGWLKVATALEGLLGVTLLALLTVAWGRKLVR